MTRLIVLAAAALVLVAPGQGQEKQKPDKAAKKDLKALQGTWRLTSLVSSGKEAPKEEVDKVKVTVKGNTYEVQVGDKIVEKGTFKIDATKNPKWMDITPTEGPDKDKTMLGIYELKKDTYRACLAQSGQPRPEAFSSTPENNHVLQTGKREKARPKDG